MTLLSRLKALICLNLWQLFKLKMMRKHILYVAMMLTGTALFAQKVQDSVSMGAGYGTDVYYSLQNGLVDTAGNMNWHLAFSVRPALPPVDVMRSTTVRINEARGVKVFKSPHASFAAFDTAGWAGWPMAHDDVKTWDIGAFNALRGANPYDFGWGFYNPGSHNVDGDKVFMMAIPSGTSTQYKKIKVQVLVRDSLWVISMGDAMNPADSAGFTINKQTFGGKMFAYFNALSNQVFNREPSAATWDIVFTRYTDHVVVPGVIDTFYSVTGILQNPAVLAAKTSRGTYDTLVPAFGTFSKNISTIGWDWKVPPMGPPPAIWTIHDTNNYYFKTTGSKNWKIEFVSFSGSGTAKTVFYKSQKTTTGIADAKQMIPAVSIYPNPANNVINVSWIHPGSINNVRVYVKDLSGRLLVQNDLNPGITQLDISALKEGIYLLSVEGENFNQVLKLVKQ